MSAFVGGGHRGVGDKCRRLCPLGVASLLTLCRSVSSNMNCGMQAGGGDADGAAEAPATSDGVGEGRERDNSTKTKRKKSSGEDEPLPIEKKQKKVTGDATVDISQLVVHALSKKGGTVRLQKLLAMVTKKLAKQDAEITDKEATLAKVCAVRCIQQRASQASKNQGLWTCAGR